jgi:hypothetical protein
MTKSPGLVLDWRENGKRRRRRMADGDQLWSVPKLEYDLLRRNASTNVRKTNLIEQTHLNRPILYIGLIVKYKTILFLKSKKPNLWNV